MKTYFLLIIFLLSTITVYAQEESESIVSKGFVLVAAGKNYEAIKKQASEVAKKINYKLNLRDLEYNKDEGLSFSKDICAEQGMEYPTYIPRGYWDAGEYVSIEYSSAYEGFTPGYYLIIVSSHDKGSPELKTALQHVKKFYKSAYIKYTDMEMGYLH